MHNVFAAMERTPNGRLLNTHSEDSRDSKSARAQEPKKRKRGRPRKEESGTLPDEGGPLYTMEEENINPYDIQQVLKGISYPATKEELIGYAEKQGAGEEITDILYRLPARRYASPQDVGDALDEIE